MPDRKWWTFGVLLFGLYLAATDLSIVNIALPRLSREFNVAPDTILWLTLPSSLAATSLQLTAGYAADLFGRKRLCVAGWTIVALSMAAAAFTHTIGQLIAVRIIQAVGNTLASAPAQAIMVDTFPPEKRGRVLGITGAVVNAGFATGPVLGGLLLDSFGWRAIFWVRAPLSALALLLVVLVVREKSARREARRLDILGAMTLFVALAATLLAINRGPSWGWTAPVVVSLLATGLGAVAAFIIVEARAPSPVLSLALFKARAFSSSILVLVFNHLGQAATVFLLPFYLIQALDYSAARAGVTLIWLSLVQVALSPLSGYVADRFGFRYQTAAGSALIALSLALLATLGTDSPVALVQVSLLIQGIGLATYAAPNSSTIIGSVPRTLLGTASAGIATARQIGTSLGLALAGTLLISVSSAAAGVRGLPADQLPDDALVQGIRVAFLAGACVASLGCVAALSLSRAKRPADTTPA